MLSRTAPYTILLLLVCVILPCFSIQLGGSAESGFSGSRVTNFSLYRALCIDGISSTTAVLLVKSENMAPCKTRSSWIRLISKEMEDLLMRFVEWDVCLCSFYPKEATLSVGSLRFSVCRRPRPPLPFFCPLAFLPALLRDSHVGTCS